MSYLPEAGEIWELRRWKSEETGFQTEGHFLLLRPGPLGMGAFQMLDLDTGELTVKGMARGTYSFWNKVA